MMEQQYRPTACDFVPEVGVVNPGDGHKRLDTVVYRSIIAQMFD
jgi:hypothetical protein